MGNEIIKEQLTFLGLNSLQAMALMRASLASVIIKHPVNNDHYTVTTVGLMPFKVASVRKLVQEAKE